MLIKNSNTAKILFEFFVYIGSVSNEDLRASFKAFPFNRNAYRSLAFFDAYFGKPTHLTNR